MTVTWQESVSEMGGRWFTGLSPTAWFGVQVGLGAVALTCVLIGIRAKPLLWRVASSAFALGAAAWSIHLALGTSWIADDAFISFRYARNFAEGNGLVWNVGERLEGYTNFLWTVLLGLGQLVGVAPSNAATVMTLGSLVVLAVGATWKLARPGWIPIAPALLVLSPAFVEFGTSGLEAGPTAMCIGFAALFLADEKRRHLAGWWVLTAALLRPDHALFFAPLGLLQLFAGRTAIRHTIAAGTVFAVYWLGRWAYFGQLFPNTFHAKSGGGAYWQQGILYWAEFALATGLWLAIPVVMVIVLLLAPPPRIAREKLPWAALAFAFFGAAVFALYIARVGGDFMEFRFGLTSLVLFALGADALLSKLAGERLWATVLAGFALLPLGLAPRVVNDREKKWFIARESSFYRVKTWFPLEIDSGNWLTGRALASLPEQGANAPPIAAGCIGMIGYLSRIPIIDRYGLTNARIASKPIKERGRPGHEKWATNDELMAEGAVWSVDPGWPGILDPVTAFSVENVKFWVLRHTPALAATVHLPDPRIVLATIKSPEEAVEQHEAVSTLYADLPDLLESYRAQWEFVDARTFKAQGNGVEQTASAVTAKDELKLAMHLACTTPRRLRWKIAKGTCTADAATCDNGQLETTVSCTGAEIRLDGFTFVSTDVDARLHRALSFGAGAIASVVRSEADAAITGLVTRLHFDSPEDLKRPELQLPEKAYEISSGPVPGQAAIGGMQGGGFLNGFKWGDLPKSRLRVSVPVTVGAPVLFSFLFAGGSACERVYAQVLDGEAILSKTCAHQDEVLRSFASIITPRTDHLVLEVVDSEDAPWGHALLDDVFVWKLPSTEARQ